MKKKILFICTANKMRSATAHEIYKQDERFEVRSAGTDQTATVPLTEELLHWADSIVVMEKHHRNTIRKKHPSMYALKKIVCLYIPDEYNYMDSVLISMLKAKFEDIYRKGLL